MIDTSSSAARADIAHHIHPFSHPRRMHEQGFRNFMVKAEGIYQYDSQGNQYIDTTAGLACVNIGYSRPDMADVLSQTAREMSFHTVFWECSNPYSARLVEKLEQVTPEHITHFLFACSGSEANDAAIKIVNWYWNAMGKPSRKHIIGREMSYHGVNLASGSLTGLPPVHENFDLPQGRISHVMSPWSWVNNTSIDDEDFGRKAAQAVENEILRIGADNVGAFIGEAIQGTGGVIRPPDNYWPLVQEICKKYDVLLILDEVITGFGRLGEWFAQDYYNIEPDIMTMAKGISSAYFPVSATGVSSRIGDLLSNMEGEFFHGYTNSCHPVGAAVVVKNIEILEQEGIVDHVREELAPAMWERLKAITDHPLVGEVRGLGAFAGIQLTANKETREFFPEEMELDQVVVKHAFDQGLVLRGLGGDILALAPCLVTTTEQINQVMDGLENALNATMKETGRG